MMARKKIVIPVAPKIVQANPGRRLFWLVLLLCGFLLAVWFSYDYGRTRALADSDTLVSSSESGQRITALEQERDTLKALVSELQQRVEERSQALKMAQAQIRKPQKVKSPSSTPAAPEAGARVSEHAGTTLKLESVDIARTDSDQVFTFRISVMREGEGNGRVVGTLWIAVNGLSNGKPMRLSLKRLSPGSRSYLKMSFEQQQEFTGELVLPQDFSPKNILIEAKPYDEKYKGTSQTFDWDAQG